jgi:hypothetical protein
MTYSAPPPGPTGPSPDGRVVDLGPTVTATRIVLDRDLSPFDRLGADERKRLLVRVLCGLVAYDDETRSDEPRLAG